MEKIKYFLKKDFRTEILSQELFEKWKLKNPVYADYSFDKFQRKVRKFRDLFIQEIVNNHLGVEVSKFGQFGIKVLDIDFKCAEDFLKTRKPYGRKETPRIIASVSNPKIMKVAWIKAMNRPKTLVLLGMEMSSSMRQVIGPRLKNRENFYPKAIKYGVKKSKCEEEIKKSIFDSV